MRKEPREVKDKWRVCVYVCDEEVRPSDHFTSVTNSLCASSVGESNRLAAAARRRH